MLLRLWRRIGAWTAQRPAASTYHDAVSERTILRIFTPLPRIAPVVRPEPTIVAGPPSPESHGARDGHLRCRHPNGVRRVPAAGFDVGERDAGRLRGSGRHENPSRRNTHC
jgi:hypothetical protein